MGDGTIMQYDSPDITHALKVCQGLATKIAWQALRSTPARMPMVEQGEPHWSRKGSCLSGSWYDLSGQTKRVKERICTPSG